MSHLTVLWRNCLVAYVERGGGLIGLSVLEVF